jgi:hypothetical protein
MAYVSLLSHTHSDMPLQKKVTKGHCGEVPSLPKGKKTIKTPRSSNTRSGCRAQQKGGEAPIDASSSTLKVKKMRRK